MQDNVSFLVALFTAVCQGEVISGDNHSDTEEQIEQQASIFSCRDILCPFLGWRLVECLEWHNWKAQLEILNR